MVQRPELRIYSLVSFTALLREHTVFNIIHCAVIGIYILLLIRFFIDPIQINIIFFECNNDVSYSDRFFVDPVRGGIYDTLHVQVSNSTFLSDICLGVHRT